MSFTRHYLFNRFLRGKKRGGGGKRRVGGIIDPIYFNGCFGTISINHLNTYSMSFNLQIRHIWKLLGFNRFIVFVLWLLKYDA